MSSRSESSTDIRKQPGPHVFVDDLDTPVLNADDRHHLEKSLRLRPGDALTVSDGAGRWRPARFGADLELTGAIMTVPPPTLPAAIAFALTKAGKPELVVQKTTEIGVDHLVIFAAERSVAQWDAPKRDRNLERLRRVAREAAMQSRRVRVPSLEFASDLVQVAGIATDRGWPLARADFGDPNRQPSLAMIAIGPEGGWSDAERSAVAQAVDLGPNVLRAETAAIVASTRLKV